MKKQLVCYECGAPVSKDDKALNFKMIRRDLTRLLCKRCLSEALDISMPELDELIIRFRDEGCTLFR